MKKILGLVLVLGGILLLLSNLNIYYVEDIMNYIWPAALILLGLASMIEDRRIHVFNGLLVTIGSLFLVQAFGIISSGEAELMIAPVVIITIGVCLLFGRSAVKTTRSYSNYERKEKDHKRHEGSQKSYTSLLNGLDEKVIDDAFVNCEVSAMLGGADIDFREIRILGSEATITLNALFGGVTAILPKNVRIIISGTPFLGGFENRTISDPSAEKTLYIRYTAMFGAVEIKN